jgi:hypothetical protein
MPTAAVKAPIVRKRTMPRSTAVNLRVRTRRPKSLLRRHAPYGVLCAALMCIFGYVWLYANLTATSFDRSRMMNEFKAEQIRNERLKVEYVRRLSPAYAMAAAEKAGMVYAKQYDYLGKSDTVARAGNER